MITPTFNQSERAIPQYKARVTFTQLKERGLTVRVYRRFPKCQRQYSNVTSSSLQRLNWLLMECNLPMVLFAPMPTWSEVIAATGCDAQDVEEHLGGTE